MRPLLQIYLLKQYMSTNPLLFFLSRPMPLHNHISTILVVKYSKQLVYRQVFGPCSNPKGTLTSSQNGCMEMEMIIYKW